MNWLKKLFKRKDKIPEFEPFIKLSNEEALADFAEADRYICGKKVLAYLRLVRNDKIVIEADPLDLSTTTKVGTFNDKPLFYSLQVQDDQIIGVNKPKDVEGGVCYGPILG